MKAELREQLFGGHRPVVMLDRESIVCRPLNADHAGEPLQDSVHSATSLAGRNVDHGQHLEFPYLALTSCSMRAVKTSRAAWFSPSGMIRSAYRLLGSTNCRCIGRTVLRY